MKSFPYDTKNMKQENKPDGHYGSKASGTEETAGRCYAFTTHNHGIHVQSTKILFEGRSLNRNILYWRTRSETLHILSLHSKYIWAKYSDEIELLCFTTYTHFSCSLSASGISFLSK